MMNDFDSLQNAELTDGIECNTEYSELNDEFELVRETQPSFGHGNCLDGACSIVWKPERHTAA